MKGDWGRCLEMRLADRPGHEVKWTLLMAATKAELTGIKAAADCALEDSFLQSRKVVLKTGLMMSPFATWTVGPDVVWATWEQCDN